MLLERISQARFDNPRMIKKESNKFDKIDYKTWFEKKSLSYDKRQIKSIYLKYM